MMGIFFVASGIFAIAAGKWGGGIAVGFGLLWIWYTALAIRDR